MSLGRKELQELWNTERNEIFVTLLRLMDTEKMTYIGFLKKKKETKPNFFNSIGICLKY